MYPTKMEANGRLYPINTDYRVALACLKAINDDSLIGLERFYAVETLLLGENVLPQDEFVLKKKIELYLRCGQEENINESEIDMDYFQDEIAIKTSIRQCYQIDLNKVDYMHWWEYNELLSGLTTDSLLSRIRELRNYDLSDVSDEKQRDKIAKAKESVALKKQERLLTGKEKESVDLFCKLIKIEGK